VATELKQNKDIVAKLKNVGVRYGNQWAVRHVSFELYQGEIVSFIGPNGAGKSSLLKTLVGLAPISEGEIELNKVMYPKNIGYVPQHLLLDRSVPFSVLEFLKLNVDAGWFQRNKKHLHFIQETLAKVGAEHLLHKKIGELSGGELQRVMIAYSLLRSPQLLLLDEPASSVDQVGAKALEQLLLYLKKEFQMTIVFVSHDLHVVNDISDRVCCMNQTLCGIGIPKETLQEHLLAQVFGSGSPAFKIKIKS
jgi:zinc transport system ATP-binding protein